MQQVHQFHTNASTGFGVTRVFVAGALNHPHGNHISSIYVHDQLTETCKPWGQTVLRPAARQILLSACVFIAFCHTLKFQDKPRGITAERAVLHHVIISYKYSVDVTPKRSTYVYVTFIYRNAPLRGKYMSLGCLIRIQTCKGARAKW